MLLLTYLILTVMLNIEMLPGWTMRKHTEPSKGFELES